MTLTAPYLRPHRDSGNPDVLKSPFDRSRVPGAGQYEVIVSTSQKTNLGRVAVFDDAAIVDIDAICVSHRTRAVREINHLTIAQVVDRHRREKRDMVQAYIAESQWGKPCQSLFSHWAKHEPVILLEAIRSDILGFTMLSYAAETAGKIHDTQRVMEALAPLLQHHEPDVREGAVYGLAQHIQEPQIRRLLAARLNGPEETSPGVRIALEEALESFEGE